MFPELNFCSLPSIPLNQKSQLPRCPAIYFVLNKNKEVLYVGKSVNLLYRWREHHRFNQLSEINKKDNISIYWLEIKPEKDIDLTLAENHYIKKLKPALNYSTVPIIHKGDFATVLAQLNRKTIVAGLYNIDREYELVLLYPCFKKYETRKIASLLKKSPSSFKWDKQYINKTKPYWVSEYFAQKSQISIKIKITPDVTYGLFWDECNKSSIPSLVVGVSMRVIDWKNNYTRFPQEEYLVDVSILDELIIDE